MRLVDRFLCSIGIVAAAILTLALCGCENNPRHSQRIENFMMNIQLMPSFHQSFNLTITSYDNYFTMMISPLEYPNECYCDFTSLKVMIPDDIFIDFYNELVKMNVLDMESDKGCSVDGIGGSITLDHFKGRTKYIEFDSPEKSSDKFKLIELVLNLAGRVFFSEPHSSLIENVSHCFDFNQGYRIIDGYPVTVRFYKEYDLGYSSIPDSIFNLADSGIPIVLDLTNIKLDSFIIRSVLNHFGLHSNTFFLVSKDLELYRKYDDSTYLLNHCCNSHTDELINEILLSGCDTNKLFYSLEGVIKKLNPELFRSPLMDVGPGPEMRPKRK